MAVNKISEEASYTIGVIRVQALPLYEGFRFALVKTTVKIRQYRSLEYGLMNVATGG